MVFLFNLVVIMKLRVFFFLLLLSSFLGFTKMNAQGLKNYQWKNRIVLLKGNEASGDSLQRQLQLLKSDSTGLTERDLKIFIIREKVLAEDGKETSLSAAELVENFDLHDFQGIILIGKDGGEKMREPFIVNPEKIFMLIDGMPMRKAEMEKEEKNKGL